jgi:MFS family permease
MPFQRSDTLKSRTFIGLILSQFLAAFNDQAIHASAMFFAIHQQTMSESTAISLMPILFFAPWALFCTLAGYLADRYSKRNSLVFWKVAEVGITLVALGGFTLGSVYRNGYGPWVVLSTVFLMGMHSAFFVPAKYGVMPEILSAAQLSNGNGVLESTSFLAVILGTVSGGILSSLFIGQEYVIGLILVGLAVVGALFSLLIQRMPAANPERPFPVNPFKPIVDNLWVMLRSRPLLLAVLGIAFFTFMVAFMRATMYMHGESQNPRWNEFKTSLVVAAVGLGIFMGSPLAGILSRGKIELGLVPIGALGMILACATASVALFELPMLVLCLVAIGFFSGFYIVPLYTLLQHRAPKQSKGDLIATSNFINVTGAIMASLLFFCLVQLAKFVGVAPAVSQHEIASGVLVDLRSQGGVPVFAAVKTGDNRIRAVGHRPSEDFNELDAAFPDDDSPRAVILQAAPGLELGNLVDISGYELRGARYVSLRHSGEPMREAHDKQQVPRFLFVGAGLMTLGILLLLCRQLPDFFLRSGIWLRSLGRPRVKIAGLDYLPSTGPAVLATNCRDFDECLRVMAATDRPAVFALLENGRATGLPLLRLMARQTGLVELHDGNPADWEKGCARAVQALARGDVLGLAASEDAPSAAKERLFDGLRGQGVTPVLPVYCGDDQVILGAPLSPGATATEAHAAIQVLGQSGER